MKKIYAIYFSPCGNTKKIVKKMAMQAATYFALPVEVIDFTLPNARQKRYDIDEESLVFFGTPVYAGRIPNKIMPFVKEGFRGNGALAVAIVTFGNRSFDNALIEQKLLLQANDFQLIAATAIAAQHSFSEKLAGGRPDARDEVEIQYFIEKLLKKVERGTFTELDIPGENPPTTYYRPLRKDLQPANFLKAKPATDAALCTNCNKCVKVCPMGSIDSHNPTLINGICIKCHACVHICPVKAKSIPNEELQSHIQMIVENYERRAESVFIM